MPLMVPVRFAIKSARSQAETRGWSSNSHMRRLVIAGLGVLASSHRAAQTPDRKLERISLALERPHLIVTGADSGEAQLGMERQILGWLALPGRRFQTVRVGR